MKRGCHWDPTPALHQLYPTTFPHKQQHMLLPAVASCSGPVQWWCHVIKHTPLSDAMHSCTGMSPCLVSVSVSTLLFLEISRAWTCHPCSFNARVLATLSSKIQAGGLLACSVQRRLPALSSPSKKSVCWTGIMVQGNACLCINSNRDARSKESGCIFYSSSHSSLEL